MSEYTEDDRLQDRLGANKMAYKMEVEYNDTKAMVKLNKKLNAEFEEAAIQRQKFIAEMQMTKEKTGYQAGMAEKKEWVGLTDEDREECLAKNEELGWWGVVNAIEQSLKEKNGG